MAQLFGICKQLMLKDNAEKKTDDEQKHIHLSCEVPYSLRLHTIKPVAGEISMDIQVFVTSLSISV